VSLNNPPNPKYSLIHGGLLPTFPIQTSKSKVKFSFMDRSMTTTVSLIITKQTDGLTSIKRNKMREKNQPKKMKAFLDI